VLIQLTAEEIILAAHHVSIMQGVKTVLINKGNVKNQKLSSQSDFAIHYAGMLGEVAVGRSINCPIQTGVTFAGDGKVDMVFHGQTIQVKTNMRFADKVLIFNRLEDFVTDWAILCNIEGASAVAIHGFTSKAKFAKLFFRHDFGYGNRYCMKADQLTPIERFYEATGLT